MLYFMLYGLIAIVFLIVGFVLGSGSRKKNDPDIDYNPSCINCKFLIYHCPEINNSERWHYFCTKLGKFNLAPDACLYYQVNPKYRAKILQCRDCKYYLKTEEGNYYCYRLRRFADADNYCSWGEGNKNECL